MNNGNLTMSKFGGPFAITKRVMNHVPWVLLMAGIGMSLGSRSAAAQDDDGMQREPRRPSITVSGEGEVKAKPDTVAISLGVVTEAATAQQAMTANNEAMQQLFDVLDQQQIAGKDRQTVRFDVSPQYRQEQPGPRGPGGPQAEEPREPRIVGYQVTNEVRIKVRQVSKLGPVLDAVVGAGSNRIHGIEFSVDDRDKLMDDARRDAIRRARAKAELFAEAADVSLGDVITIREEDFARPMPQPQYMMMEARSAPIAEGEQTITARVQVTFRLNTQSE